MEGRISEDSKSALYHERLRSEDVERVAEEEKNRSCPQKASSIKLICSLLKIREGVCST